MITALYIAAALLPAAFLMRYIYRQDRVEKEPAGLLICLIPLGALAGLIAGVLNEFGISLLSLFFSSEESTGYILALAFLVVGVVEEGCKFLMLRLATWNNPNFNFRFDGVVYAVFVSLGFAALENVVYVFAYGLSVAITRAFLSVPAHMGFAVFMGSYYGRAKICEASGDRRGISRNLFLAYLTAVFLHGFYDSCAMSSGTISLLLFAGFVLIMYIVVIRRIRREAYTDCMIDPSVLF